MSYNIVHGSNNGGTLAIVPASLVTQTVEKANDFFRPNFSVQFPGKRRRFRGMAITTWEQEKKGNEFSETMQLACAKWNFDYAQPFGDTQRPKPKPAEFKGNPDQLFRDLGIAATVEPPNDVGGRLPCTLFVVVSRNMLQRPAGFENIWGVLVKVLVGDNKWYRILLNGGCCFGYLVIDEIHEWKGVDASQALCVFRMLQRQLKKPWITALSGTPVSTSLVDLTFAFSLLKGFNDREDINNLTASFKELNSVMDSEMDEDDSAQVSTELTGIKQRSGDSTFLDIPLMDKPKAKSIPIKCPIGDKYRAALSRLTMRVQKATIEDVTVQLNKKEKPSAKTIRNAIYNRPDVCNLSLAIQFPGLAYAMERAEDNGFELPINWETFKAYVCSVKTPEPRQYDGCFPEEWEEYIQIIIDEMSRLTELKNAAEKAYYDNRMYDSGYNGPKSLLVLADRPCGAKWVKIFAERELGPNRFESTWIHGGMSKVEKQKAMDWFGDFYDDEGNYRKKTRILFSTYRLCSTGLDGLKVACWMVKSTVIRNYGTLAQATARIDRLGQKLPPIILTFESPDHPM
ncbi:hypothetical protein Brms1b_013653 [Colletotrichum noveboracense]|nr:hypothetical protein Brms1b_013653 [Colletotrichum noveboracense]